ncbi:hypothetical protein ACTMTJ_11995 [Phytohabitans sp. LJ34]|uniref:hypothetical protein n=1 Tax=Phytohabitans sp. LJ34 TaxID=3452217 RepID=UPI003F8C2469
MRVTLSPDGPGDLSALADALAAADPPIAAEPAADGAYTIHIGLSGVAPLFNAVTSFVVRQTADTAVLIRSDTGAEARVDRRVATDPFEVLMAVSLFNPPVGLG